MNISSDDRRLAFFNIFPETPGQVNIVRLYPGSICAWHRHRIQADYYFPVSGVVKVGAVYGNGVDAQWRVVDAHNPRVVEVPPWVWHGYTAIGGEAVLLQYLTHKYDPTDEERRSVADMGISWAVESR